MWEEMSYNHSKLSLSEKLETQPESEDFIEYCFSDYLELNIGFENIENYIKTWQRKCWVEFK